MPAARNRRFSTILALGILPLVFAGVGCEFSYSGPPEGAVLGRKSLDDYAPSAIQVGNLQQFWWCGEAHNPNKPDQTTDTIQYATIDATTHMTSEPKTVMGETPGAWDSAFTCNPKVVRGTFVNPLSDNQNYSYAMYYVATSNPGGLLNNIGVAFSNDGITWRKYPQPVIRATTQTNWGVGQPAVYNSDQKAGIWLFYEDLNDPPWNQHVITTSTDGIHFTTIGKLTTNGLNPTVPEASWGDMAYDSATGYWYAVFNMPRRGELGQMGITLYRIPKDSLISGSTPWQQLKSFDTNVTGNEVTFIASFLRDQYGNVNVGPYPTIQMFTSISNPKPAWNASADSATKSADPRQWDIGTVQWVPNSPLVPLNRYLNSSTHEVTTGWIDPAGNFKLESSLGHLYESPQNGVTTVFYGCKTDTTDYFISTDLACEGKRIQGINGYGYSKPVAGLALVPIYRCSSGHDHFVSKDSKCEGQSTEKLLGYLMP